MPPEGRDPAYLWDILEAARAVQRYTSGHSRADFDADRILQRAVERELEIIGEAAARVSDALKAAHPEVPWKLIVGQRNVLIHDYGDIDYDRLWMVVVEHVPQLVMLIHPLVPELPGT
jgi:uncharacterized protein with HEPN domain